MEQLWGNRGNIGVIERTPFYLSDGFRGVRRYAFVVVSTFICKLRDLILPLLVCILVLLLYHYKPSSGGMREGRFEDNCHAISILKTCSARRCFVLVVKGRRYENAGNKRIEQKPSMRATRGERGELGDRPERPTMK